MKLIEKLILATAVEEDLNLDQFIDAVRADPDDWYAFRRDELMKFVESILSEVATLTDTSEVVPTGPTFEDLCKHFGMIDEPSEPEEKQIDWTGFDEPV